MTSTTKMGCTCTFFSANSTYLQAIGDELMVRTHAGRQVCRISDAQFQSLGTPGSELACSGVRLSIREIGERIASPETDSSEGPATLSANAGRLDGSWGCAC